MTSKIKTLAIDVIQRPFGEIQKSKSSDTTCYKKQGILRITTTDGIEGNCFIGEFWDNAEPHFQPILEVIKPELIGRCVSEREWLWTRHKYHATQFKLTTRSWAPVDIALWDIAGKMANQPVYRLLGADRDCVPAYASYPVQHDSSEGYVSEAMEALDKGFTAYKIHPGNLRTKEVIQMISMVRKTVHDEIQLMLDPDCGYNLRKALKIGRALDDHGFHWLEDPVPYFDIDAIAELNRCLLTPLSMSDQLPDQLFGSAHYIRQNIVPLPRGTSARLGITGLRKLCALAEGFGLNCEIGTAGNPLLNAANLHVVLSVSNCDYYEYLYPERTERFGLTHYIEPDSNGIVTAPESSGLGFLLDEKWIAKHKIATLE